VLSDGNALALGGLVWAIAYAEFKYTFCAGVTVRPHLVIPAKAGIPFDLVNTSLAGKTA